MRVQLNYFAQIRQAAAADNLSLDLADNATVLQALRLAVDRHGDAFRKLIFDDSGRLRPSIILLINGVPSAGGVESVLNNGDNVSIFSPVAGG
jgi:MoaD family protein